LDLKKYEVPADKLRWECDPRLFDFKCTKDLAPLREFIGQDRAARAIEFGLNMTDDGYNIYVAGVTGTGKTTMVKTYIEKLIKEREERGETFKLDDWCYIYNFKEPDRPQIVNLPQGKGNVFRERLAQLLNRVRSDLRTAFSSEEYKVQKQKTIEDSQAMQQEVFGRISEEARDRGFALKMTAMGPVLIPIVDGKPIDEKQYIALKDRTKKEIEARQNELLKILQTGIEQVKEMQRQAVENLHQLDNDIGEFTVSQLYSLLLNVYAEWPKIVRYIENLKSYTLENIGLFKDDEEPAHPLLGMPVNDAVSGKNPFLPFQVNVFVDNSDTNGTPIVIEPNPNFTNLFGVIERRFILGGYLSDHSMIKSGALAMANGGYLLLSARDVVLNPIVWLALKRAAKNKEVRIEDPYEQFGFFAPQGMRPEPMPINVKIVLIGDALLYQMLSMYDEEFWEIFRVKADFNHEIDKNEKNIKDYAAFIAVCCDECKTKHFDPAGVAKLIEYSARMVSDQERLSTRFSQIKELVQEANYWATQENVALISAKHVQKALAERIFRHNLADEQTRDLISRGILMIDLEGTVVGQVNGLSVYSLGDITLGKPSRITANTYMGRGGVINIERETQMSGPIHDKGVLILSGYMGWKYAQDRPLSLSTSICFEQSYDGIEGDSASSTELYAILSSLADVPIRQNIAVTGSVNQKGVIQPIGGVNHKIEGFFRVCQAKGFSGEQGVLIPHQNIRNLMLREEVVEAVRKGQFHIYTAKTIDEGIEILTGIPAGTRQQDGTYPDGTINFLVDRKLQSMSDKLKRLYADEKAEKKDL
jgi:predicted ATP-dependent protease